MIFCRLAFPDRGNSVGHHAIRGLNGRGGCPLKFDAGIPADRPRSVTAAQIRLHQAGASEVSHFCDTFWTESRPCPLGVRERERTRSLSRGTGESCPTLGSYGESQNEIAAEEGREDYAVITAGRKGRPIAASHGRLARNDGGDRTWGTMRGNGGRRWEGEEGGEVATERGEAGGPKSHVGRRYKEEYPQFYPPNSRTPTQSPFPQSPCPQE
jgi:hypothetical protein